jgi:hypothetical protein
MTAVLVAEIVEEAGRSSSPTVTLILSGGAFGVWIIAFSVAIRRAQSRSRRGADHAAATSLESTPDESD